jgi:hypothetical protein
MGIADQGSPSTRSRVRYAAYAPRLFPLRFSPRHYHHLITVIIIIITVVIHAF